MSGLAPDAMLPSELHEVRALLAAVDRELESRGHTTSADEHRQAMDQLRARFEQRFDALARAHQAAASLRRLTSPRELLLQAPRALVAGTRLRRAIVGVIGDGALIPVAAHFAVSATVVTDRELAEDALELLAEPPFRLERQLIETDAVRRRRAMLVANVELSPRVDRRMSTGLGWRSYVVSPLVCGAAVIGMVHADRGDDVAVDAFDRDVLREFTTVLSQVYESTDLRRQLRYERDALRSFLDRLAAASASLADAPLTFGAYPEANAQFAGAAPGAGTPLAPSGGDERLLISGLLTRRELDVLRLLADGGTNRTIADALVLSDTTVKFHVNNILRKLRVANRAEAVARYLSLLGLPTPQ